MHPKGPDIIPAWQTASRELGIRVAATKTLTHADGTTIVYPIHLSDFGARNGALLWPDYDFADTDDVERVARYWGCSYAVINPDVYSVYDRAVFISFLCRLGLRRSDIPRPAWYFDDEF